MVGGLTNVTIRSGNTLQHIGKTEPHWLDVPVYVLSFKGHYKQYKYNSQAYQ